MAISANTLGQTADSLMSQLSAGTITFQSYRDSMNSVIQSTNNNPDMLDTANNGVAIHIVDLAIRITKGEGPSTPTRKK
jgi:hypothetical protein